LLFRDRRPLGGPRTLRVRQPRVPAALAAVLLVLANLLGALHDASTSHVRCAAHGELVDSDGPLAVVASPAAVAALAALTTAPGSARGHGDSHCLLAAALRASRIAPPPPVVAAAAITVVDLRSAVPPGLVAAPGASLLRIAPKTSPPA
jgi:hypothetical protein